MLAGFFMLISSRLNDRTPVHSNIRNTYHTRLNRVELARLVPRVLITYFKNSWLWNRICDQIRVALFCQQHTKQSD